MDEEVYELCCRWTNFLGLTKTKMEYGSQWPLQKCLSLDLASDRLKWRNAIRPVTQQTGFQPTLSGCNRFMKHVCMKKKKTKKKTELYVPNNTCNFNKTWVGAKNVITDVLMD